MGRNAQPNLPNPRDDMSKIETPLGPVYFDTEDDSSLYTFCTRCQEACGGFHSIKHGGELDRFSRKYATCPECGSSGEPIIEWRDSKTDKKV